MTSYQLGGHVSVEHVALAVAVVATIGCHALTGLGPEHRAVPEHALRAAALEIERAVQAGDGDVLIEETEGLVVRTEPIIQAIRSRAARSEQVNIFLDSGHGWECRDGLLWVIQSKAYGDEYTRKERGRNALIVMSENEDRRIIYEGLRNANGFSRKALSTIRAVFYEARVDSMHNGQKYEAVSGEVAYKGSGAGNR